VVTRRAALACSSPALVVLVGSLLWNAWDRREQLLDRAVRLIAFSRD